MKFPYQSRGTNLCYPVLPGSIVESVYVVGIIWMPGIDGTSPIKEELPYPILPGGTLKSEHVVGIISMHLVELLLL